MYCTVEAIVAPRDRVASFLGRLSPCVITQSKRFKGENGLNLIALLHKERGGRLGNEASI